MDYDYRLEQSPCPLGGVTKLAYNERTWAPEGRDWEVRCTVHYTVPPYVVWAKKERPGGWWSQLEVFVLLNNCFLSHLEDLFSFWNLIFLFIYWVAFLYLQLPCTSVSAVLCSWHSPVQAVGHASGRYVRRRLLQWQDVSVYCSGPIGDVLDLCYLHQTSTVCVSV